MTMDDPGTGARTTTRRGTLRLLGAGAAGMAALLDGGPARAGTGPAAGTATAAAGGPADAAAESVTAPQTLAWTAPGPGVARPGFAVEAVALQWAGEERPRLRTAAGWRTVDGGCRAARGDGPPAPAADRHALVHLAGASTVELDLPAGARAVLLDTTTGPARRIPLRLRDHVRQVAGCRYVSRARWGADESLRFAADGTESWPATYWPVQALTVHHTDTPNGEPDPAARMRSIYYDHAILRGFGDIGYHFFVDEQGRIYEGRWSGDDRVPGFDAQGRMVNAGHVGGYNAGNVGIALLGTFTDVGPTPAARRTLVGLLTLLARWQHVDPVQHVAYVNPVSGATADVLGISGHRDWPSPTECPGNTFYPELDSVRRDVAAALRAAKAPSGRLAPEAALAVS